MLPLGFRTWLSQGVRRAVAIEKPILDPALQTALRRRYAGDVAALERLLGRPTGWWPTAKYVNGKIIGGSSGYWPSCRRRLRTWR